MPILSGLNASRPCVEHPPAHSANGARMRCRKVASASSTAQKHSPRCSTLIRRISALARQVLGVQDFFGRLYTGAQDRTDHFVAPQAQFFGVEFKRVALPRLDLGNGFEGKP